MIVGYNADKNGVSTRDTKEGRAYKLFNTKDLLPEDAIKLLEEAAYEGVPFAEAAKRNVEGGLYKTIQERLEAEINVAYELFGKDIAADSGFVGTGVLTADGSKSGENLNIANAQLNLIPGNFLHNFAQVYLNNAINTSAINELILGDESITLKDFILCIAKISPPRLISIDFSIFFAASSKFIKNRVISLCVIVKSKFAFNCLVNTSSTDPLEPITFPNLIT